jgi:hypothetical protein
MPGNGHVRFGGRPHGKGPASQAPRRAAHPTRMSKHDLQARPIYHHKRESIEAHLAVVFAALAVTHEIETRTGWSIKRFVQTTRRYRTIAIRAGDHVLTAEEPLPAELCDALAVIT